MEGCREDGDRLCSKVRVDRTRTNRHKLQKGKFSLGRRNDFFTIEVTDIGIGSPRG